MYCTQCGKQIPDDSKFCTYCGHPLATIEQSQVKQNDETNVNNPQESYRISEQTSVSCDSIESIQDKQPLSRRILKWIINALLAIFTVLTILLMAARSSYDMQVEDNSWLLGRDRSSNEYYMTIEITDKLTDGSLAFDYDTGLFTLDQSDKKFFTPLTKENVENWEQSLLSHYQKKCLYLALAAATIAIALYLFRRFLVSRKIVR